MFHKICVLCNKEFDNRSNNIIICNDKHIVKCSYCGKEFELRPQQRLRANCKDKLEFYCCRSCQAKAKKDEIHTKEAEEKRLKTRLKNNNGNYFDNERLKKNNLEKYGVEWNIQREEVQNKIKQTMNSKYGSNSPWSSQEVKDKRKETFIQNYGVDNPWKDKQVRDKCIKVAIERYGSPNNIEKTKETNLKRYGHKYSLQNELVKQRISNTCLSKYGVKYNCLTDNCISKQGNTISNINKEISNILKENNIENELEYKVDGNLYDIHILNTNILLEINPTYTHNSTIGPYFKGTHVNPKDKQYHFNRTISSIKNGYHCIHIFDWDDINKIINMLISHEKIYARKCDIKEVDKSEANKFLDENHLQNKCRGNTINIGLYYDNKLIQIITFGKPRYNKNYEWELLRLCTKSKYNVVGGTTKLWKYFIEKYKPTSVISYCDNSKFDGSIYKILGFELSSYGQPNLHWYKAKTRTHITNNLLNQRGFDQLFGTNYGKGTSNRELMLKHNFVEIYDCGQSTYIWTNNLKRGEN